MSRTRVLPKLVMSGLRKNTMVYLPYILTTAFSIGVYFLFTCIIGNPMLLEVPYAGYLLGLLDIGRVVLALILIPFLFYTNSFLIKRRKKEFGLYTILGLEKKHTAIMVFMETLMLYIISIAIGLGVAVAFSKLVFGMMLKMCSMPAGTSFTMDVRSLISTLEFFGIVSLLNLVSNLWQVTRINPTELLKESKKGEKETKHLWLLTIIGLINMGLGYYLGITSKLDSGIFLRFPLAVIFVVICTYLLFTSGSVKLLQLLKKNKKLYYKKENFVTISGMLYRMKKNAASLANICLFSTMIMVTVLCTVSLRLGEADSIKFFNPYEGSYTFSGEVGEQSEKQYELIKEMAEKNHVTITDNFTYPYGSMDEIVTGNVLVKDTEKYTQDNQMTVRILTLDDYNRIRGEQKTLQDGEILLFSTKDDFEFDQINLNGNEFKIKEELDSIGIDSKDVNSLPNRKLYIIVKDQKTWDEVTGDFKYYSIVFNAKGDELQKRALFTSIEEAMGKEENNLTCQDILSYGDRTKALDGGLLFVGIFFGIIFAVCLVLVMYYKQISEGMEDQDSFHIMEQVGMSDEDVKKTIKKQIMLVFFLPLIAAICHMFGALKLVVCLLYALNQYNTMTTVTAALIIMVVFGVFYGFSYLRTAKTYYKLVH